MYEKRAAKLAEKKKVARSSMGTRLYINRGSQLRKQWTLTTRRSEKERLENICWRIFG
jgi:hypothetical protein